jgi:hypothetical protein
MRKTILLIKVLSFALFLSGCATQQTFLKNDQTEQYVECGGERSGSMMFGVIGYSIQQSDAEDCVNRYLQNGFRVLSVGDGGNATPPPAPNPPVDK